MRGSYAAVLVITVAGAGCDSESPSRLLPSAPTAVVPPAVVVTPPAVVVTPGAVSGKVWDTAYRPIAGAIVEVLDGAQAGLTASTDGNGQYFFAGAFEEGTRLSAKKSGYLDGLSRIGPYCERCNPHYWVYFSLGLPIPPMNLAGEYTVTVEAAAGCVLPPEARTRSYGATIVAETNQPTAADTYWRVEMRAASLQHGYAWEGFWVNVAGDYAQIDMGDGHGQPGLVESLGADTYYSVGAWATGTIGAQAGATFTLPFEGEIVHCVMKPGLALFDLNGRFTCSGQSFVTRASCPGGGLTFTRK